MKHSEVLGFVDMQLQLFITAWICLIQIDCTAWNNAVDTNHQSSLMLQTTELVSIENKRAEPLGITAVLEFNILQFSQTHFKTVLIQSSSSIYIQFSMAENCV